MEWDRAQWANTRTALYLKVPRGHGGAPRLQSDEERFLKWQREWDNTKHQWVLLTAKRGALELMIAAVQGSQKGTEFMIDWKDLTPRHKQSRGPSTSPRPLLHPRPPSPPPLASPPPRSPPSQPMIPPLAMSNLQLQLDAVQARANALDKALQRTPRESVSSVSYSCTPRGRPASVNSYNSPRPWMAVQQLPLVPVDDTQAHQQQQREEQKEEEEEEEDGDSPRTVARQMMQAWDEKWSPLKKGALAAEAQPQALIVPDAVAGAAVVDPSTRAAVQTALMNGDSKTCTNLLSKPGGAELAIELLRNQLDTLDGLREMLKYQKEDEQALQFKVLSVLLVHAGEAELDAQSDQACVSCLRALQYVASQEPGKCTADALKLRNKIRDPMLGRGCQSGDAGLVAAALDAGANSDEYGRRILLDAINDRRLTIAAVNTMQPKAKAKLYSDLGPLGQAELLTYTDGPGKADLFDALEGDEQSLMILALNDQERAETFNAMPDEARLNLLAAGDNEAIAGMFMVMDEPSKRELLSEIGAQRRRDVFTMMWDRPEVQAAMGNMMNQEDSAELFEGLSDVERGGLLAVLDPQHKAALFVQLPEAQQKMVLATLVHERKMADMFHAMTADQQSVVIAAASDTEERAQIFELMSPENRLFLIASSSIEERSGLFEALAPSHRALMLSICSGADKTELFGAMQEDGQSAMLELMSTQDIAFMFMYQNGEQRSQLLNAMTSANKTQLLQQLPREEQQAMLSSQDNDFHTEMVNQLTDTEARPLVKLLSVESKAKLSEQMESQGKHLKILEWLSVHDKLRVFQLMDQRLQNAIMMQADLSERVQMFAMVAPDAKTFSELKKQGWFASKGHKEISELMKAIPSSEEKSLVFAELSKLHQTALIRSVAAGERAEMFMLSLGVPVTSEGHRAMVLAGSATENAEMYALLPSQYQVWMLHAMEAKGKANMFQALSLEQQKIMCSQLSVEERDVMLSSMPHQF